MATNFPTSLDSLTNPTASDTMANPDHAVQHANINDAMEAIQAKVGIDGSAVTTSIDYKINRTISVEKTADETKTQNTTTADDASLKFTAQANTKYRFFLKVFFTTSAAPDFKYQLTGPAANYLAFRRDTNVHGSNTVTATLDVAYITADTSLVANATGTGQIRIRGVVHVGGAGGTLAFRWAQNTSSTEPTVVKAGSYMQYTLVG